MKFEQAKAQLRAGGMSGADAAIVTEMVEHAVMEAMETIKRIVDPAPPHLKAMILESTMASLVSIWNGMVPETIKAAVLVAEGDAREGLVVAVRT